MTYRSFNLTLFLWLLTGCGVRMCEPQRSDMSPETVVKKYLEVAFNMKDLKHRELLLSYTTGDLKSSLMNATDETIRELYIQKNYDVENLFIAPAQYKTPIECEVSFNLKYQEEFTPLKKQGGEARVEVKSENTVSLLKGEDGWSIQGVIGKSSQVAFPLVR